jgi:ABC-type Fe3+/spermidine/putrescine transport system ATPase subunit
VSRLPPREGQEGTLVEGKPFLKLGRISKRFHGFRALDDISLEIARGEIFSLLGPSGCGKSTTLRIIAGLEQPETGEITLDGKVLVSAEGGVFVPSQKRNMGMVFQSYAIWPHLSVYDTVAYPLAIRKLAKDEIAGRVHKVLQQVGLAGHGERMASTLSGGQQQRVVLARALVYEPHVLLLDEPFSNLDSKLREQMRIDLKLLQQRLRVTVILVTHDQVEALGLSDRIAVMNAGRIEQIGTPSGLYDDPASAFVRDFIGSSLKLEGRVIEAGAQEATIELEGGGRLTGRLQNGSEAKVGDAIVATVRPEKLIAHAGAAGDGNALEATIKALLFVGDRYECVLQIGAQEVRTFLPRPRNSAGYAAGAKLRLTLPAHEVVIWPRSS